MAERSRASVLVRPSNTPVTDLCTSTSALTWADVQDAGSFKDAIVRLDEFLKENVISQKNTFSFVTLGTWDLRVQIPREARDKGVVLPDYIQHPRVYDLRSEYLKWLGLYTEAQSFLPSSIADICSTLEIDSEGNSTREIALPCNSQTLLQVPHPRRATQECVMLNMILQALAQRSDPTSSQTALFRRPLDAKADFSSFVVEGSKVLHLNGLAHDTTQSELESWFTSCGGRPVAFWTLRTPDIHKPTGTGYAVFASHQEAADSLMMNGRALGDRTIEVSPSSPRILDRAAEILTPFPPSKNRPRPGDWTCPSCGFSNFQRRTACFRCAYPSVNSHDPLSYYQPPLSTGLASIPGFPSQPVQHNNGVNNSLRNGGGGNVPFRAGDWTCQNCTFHNFARNVSCKNPTCRGPRNI